MKTALSGRQRRYFCLIELNRFAQKTRRGVHFGLCVFFRRDGFGFGQKKRTREHARHGNGDKNRKSKHRGGMTAFEKNVCPFRRNGIVSAAAERLTAQNALDCQHASLERAVNAQRFQRICGTRRRKAAARGFQRRQKAAVESYNRRQTARRE